MRTSIIVILLSISAAVPAQSADQINISKTVNKYVERDGFSGTILVAEKGRAIFKKSFGLAYYSTPDTIQNDYHYSIASVTKLFTSIRILQLVETGQLTLDRSVSSCLPEYKDRISEKVTIHDLLLHLSGLPNENDLIYRKPLDVNAIVDKTLAREDFKKHGAFSYNNLDYILLGLIIERSTENSWQNEIKDYILEPLKMESTGFLKYGYYPRNFAYSYSKKWHGMKQDPLFYIENFYAAGCMYSTVEDILKLDQALYADNILNERGKALLGKSYPEYNYSGYGVWNYNYPFVDSEPLIMERRGGILGTNVVLVRLVEDNYSIIVLSNDDRFNPDSFGDENNLREMLIKALYTKKSSN